MTFSDGMRTSAEPTNLMCGCHKEQATFSEKWGAKVVADTGNKYRLPGGDCAYIDNDGKCHAGPPASNGSTAGGSVRGGAGSASGNLEKMEVSGVAI